ncbi:O-methyltransferase [Paenibacillus sp. UNC499MF]|uniref:O-methyltransferase n=1 Tax=Paenibacillus sp. UNC499MF TaxID=1502751 RepID=UPI0008A0861C|nr:O-methyltransferase [Paenibacillus sp. UNC499MF]SEG44863.1 Predicted O-methyltransferase YrrM [Paenibacillus sp. UNC499MF]
MTQSNEFPEVRDELSAASLSSKWSDVDACLNDWLVPAHPVMTEVLANNAKAGLPPIDVAPNQGKLLHLLARSSGARSILEIGTLGGYSTIWLARALPEDGRIVTLEYDPHHAETARQNLRGAGVSHLAELRVGEALGSLEQLDAEGAGPFDLIFIDADKPNNPDYFRWALKLSRPGTLIIGDNVIRDGEVANPHSTDPRVQGVRTFLELIAAEPRVTATALQTVGSKGYDGFVLALVTA